MEVSNKLRVPTDGVHGQVAAPLAGARQAQRRLVLLVHQRGRQHHVAPCRRLRPARPRACVISYIHVCHE